MIRGSRTATIHGMGSEDDSDDRGGVEVAEPGDRARTEGWLGNAIADRIEHARLRNLEAIADPMTFGILDDVIGPRAGWRCLELGAGAGSVARRLAELVGPTGHVVAADIDLRFLEDLPSNVEVRQLDAATADFGEEAFDLIHFRAVLAYVPGRDEIVGRLLRALRPGGWILAEEPVFAMPTGAIDGDPDSVLAASGALFTSLLEGAGTCLDFGARVPGLLRRAGMVDVANRGWFEIATGGDGRWSTNSRLLWEGLRARIVDAGIATTEELDRVIAAAADQDSSWISPLAVSTWGRRREP